MALLVLRDTVPSQKRRDVDVHYIARNLLSEEDGGRAPSFAARGGFFVRLGVTIQPLQPVFQEYLTISSHFLLLLLSFLIETV